MSPREPSPTLRFLEAVSRTHDLIAAQEAASIEAGNVSREVHYAVRGETVTLACGAVTFTAGRIERSTMLRDAVTCPRCLEAMR